MDNKNLKIKQTVTLAYENHIKQNYDLAENLYNKVLKIDPNNVDASFLLGTLSSELNRLVYHTGIEPVTLPLVKHLVCCTLPIQ